MYSSFVVWLLISTVQVGHLGEAYGSWVHQPIISKKTPRFFKNDFLEVTFVQKILYICRGKFVSTIKFPLFLQNPLHLPYFPICPGQLPEKRERG